MYQVPPRPSTPPLTGPRAFALVDDDGDAGQVVAYGLALPDGSAFSVSWPSQTGTGFCSTRSAERNALLRGAELVWITNKEAS